MQSSLLPKPGNCVTETILQGYRDHVATLQKSSKEITRKTTPTPLVLLRRHGTSHQCLNTSSHRFYQDCLDTADAGQAQVPCATTPVLQRQTTTPQSLAQPREDALWRDGRQIRYARRYGNRHKPHTALCRKSEFRPLGRRQAHGQAGHAASQVQSLKCARTRVRACLDGTASGSRTHPFSRFLQAKADAPLDLWLHVCWLKTPRQATDSQTHPCRAARRHCDTWVQTLLSREDSPQVRSALECRTWWQTASGKKL